MKYDTKVEYYSREEYSEMMQNKIKTWTLWQFIFLFQNQTEDTLRQELTALQEDKFNYETTAKVKISSAYVMVVYPLQ